MRHFLSGAVCAGLALTAAPAFAAAPDGATLPATWGIPFIGILLSIAVFPLVVFTSDRVKMGAFANPMWLKVLAWATGLLIAGLNVWLLVQTFQKWLS